MKSEVMLKKAHFKIKIGRLNDAINIYKKILRKTPNNFNALFMLGTIYAKQNNFTEAIRYLEKAVEINPEFPDLQNNLGNVYKAVGDIERAKLCYMHCLRLDPNHASAHHGLGTIYSDDTKEQQKALEYFRRALSLDPSIAEAHFGYGAILITLGNPEGLKHLEHAYLLNPSQPGLLNKLGIGYFKFGKTQDAIVRLKAALKQDPDDNEVKYFLTIAEGRKPDKELEEQYVEEIFNKFSGGFEQHLVERLGYKIPTISREMILQIYGSDRKFMHMVDLGCGTGLGGHAFRDCTEQLTGIDLSEKMLQEAARKNVYDRLLHGEVITVLEKLDDFFDFFLAADMIVYFQELEALFESIRKKSAPGAVLVFSTESYDDHEDFIIRESGRIAHNSRYIHRLADSANIKIVAEQRLPLRKEHENWIEGDLYICELP